MHGGGGGGGARARGRAGARVIFRLVCSVASRAPLSRKYVANNNALSRDGRWPSSFTQNTSKNSPKILID